MLSFPIIYYRNRVVPICWTAGQKNSYTRVFSKKDSGGHLQERKIGVRCRLRLQWRKPLQVKGVTRPPIELPWASQLFIHFPGFQNLANRLHDKQRVGSVRRCQGHPPNRANFFSIYKTLWLARPGQDNPSMCERSWLSKGVNFFVI